MLIRKVFYALITLFILLILTETTIWLSGKIGIINHSIRVMEGAPIVKVNGQTLSYQGTVIINSNEIVEYKLSDDNTKLFKAKGTPDNPPWVFLYKEGDNYYRYKFPKIPWKL